MSIIISYHSEGQSFLQECIDQVRNSVHIPFEIIVVDDFSSTQLEPIENVTIIRHTERLGIGCVFDSGVKQSQYDSLVLMACDTRYIDNGWSDLLYQEILAYPKSLICTTCTGINSENMDMTLRRDTSKHSGATILIFHDHISNPRKPKYFRGICEASWLPYSTEPSHEIPCILGACYGTTKAWYNHIDGFWGHRVYGNLEPYISMKSYLFGGSCRVIPVETAHIFKQVTTHDIPQDAVLYNKLLIAKLLFPDSHRLISFLGTDPNMWRAMLTFQNNSALIEAKRQEYLAKTVMTMDEFVKRHGLDYRK